mgnify:CR=1 FL=1
MISLIAAVARNGAIGRNQQLLWRLPEDMRYFRETTSGKTVIMGRKTWESLPPAYRPLPNRRNIVLSRNPAYLPRGGDLACSIEDALRLAGGAAEVFIIGGEELYRQTMPLATRLYITEVAEECPGDAFFPEVASGEWREISRRVGTSRAAGSALRSEAPAFDFVVYERR